MKYMKKQKLIVLTALAALTLGMGALFACSPQTLPSPSNLQISDDEMLTWDGVKRAQGYVVELNGTEYETSESNFDLFALLIDPNISYEIRILALGDSKTYNDSEWSNSITYTLDKAENYDWFARETSDGSGLEVKPSKSLSGKITIPSVINNIPVVGIADSAFSGHTELTGIVLPDSIKTISNNAFKNCTALKRIAFNEELTAIGASAFENCTSLTNVTLPENLRTIGEDCFSACKKINKIAIPSSVEEICRDAFRDCSSLAAVEFSDGLREIGSYAFSRCAIERITLPFTLQKIIGSSFSSNENLRSITVSKENPFYRSEQNCLIKKSTDTLIMGCKTSVIPSSVKTIGMNAFYGVGFDSITIPHGVTNIELSAFQDCKNLRSVIFPDSLISLGGAAFEHCEQLEKVDIPHSVTGLDHTTFKYCPSLASVHVDEKNPIFRSEGNCIIAKSNNELLFCPETVFEIPKSIEIIGRWVFSDRTFTEFTIPVGVKEIKDCAFDDCYDLQTVYIPQTVTKIGAGAFRSCRRLSVVLPESLTDIGSGAFNGTELDNNFPAVAVYVSNIRFVKEELFSAVQINRCEIAYENGYPYVAAINTNSSGEKCSIAAQTDFAPGYVSKTGLLYPPYAPTRKGYTFLGWATAEGGEVVFASVPVVNRFGEYVITTFSKEQLQNIPYDSKLYAVWEKNA